MFKTRIPFIIYHHYHQKIIFFIAEHPESNSSGSFEPACPFLLSVVFLFAVIIDSKILKIACFKTLTE